MSWDQMGDPNGRELGPMMRCCGEQAPPAAYRAISLAGSIADRSWWGRPI